MRRVAAVRGKKTALRFLLARASAFSYEARGLRNPP
jgi:hypothetical protein